MSTRIKGLKGLGMRVSDVKGFEPTGGEWMASGLDVRDLDVRGF